MPTSTTSSYDVDRVDPQRDALLLLRLAARLLLEYNVRSSRVERQLRRLATHLGVDVAIAVSYRGVTLHLHDGRTLHEQVPEYRLNVAVHSVVWRTLDGVCRGNVTSDQAMQCLQSVERSAPAHNRLALALIFGLAASALACILRADVGTIITVAISSAVGLFARRYLGKHHWPVFTLPFAAATLAGIIGGIAILLTWTQTSGLCLLVPVLMLVPGPHLINGLYDIFENYIQTGLCRLALAAGILLAAAAGVIFGGSVIMGLRQISGTTSDVIPLTLALDMALAGVAAAGFGAFYNTPWRVLWISIVCGMVGHGVRFVCLDLGVGLPSATLLACIVIGLFASAAVVRLGLPFSSIAFAAAVPMMPGTLIFRSIAGAVQLAIAGPEASPALATRVLVLLIQASAVVGAMAAGLLTGALVTSLVQSILQGRADCSAPPRGE